MQRSFRALIVRRWARSGWARCGSGSRPCVRLRGSPPALGMASGFVVGARGGLPFQGSMSRPGDRDWRTTVSYGVMKLDANTLQRATRDYADLGRRPDCVAGLPAAGTRGSALAGLTSFGGRSDGARMATQPVALGTTLN
jgi:hypothetical protein